MPATQPLLRSPARSALREPYAPKLLGVVNLSPESMVRDSVARGPEAALSRARVLLEDGVHLIDLGGRSITPDAAMIDDAEEQARLAPAATALRDAGIRFSVDTWSSATAIAALSWGSDFINFTGADPSAELLDAIARARASLSLTCMPYGDAYRMRSSPPLPQGADLVDDVLGFLSPRVERAHSAGIDEVVIDPNLGIIHPSASDYEKIHRQLELVWEADRLRTIGCPLLFYAARKPERLARIMMASAVLHARPDYIRTHEPEILQGLMNAAAAARGVREDGRPR